MARPTLLVVQLESTIQLQIVIGITPTAITVRIPQQTIVLVGKHERHADLSIILEQVFILSLHIQLLRLVLPQAIESLIVGAVEEHTPRESMAMGLGNLGPIDTHLPIGNAEGLEGLSVLGFLQHFLTIGIEEGNSTRLLINTGFDMGSLDGYFVAVRHRKLGLSRLWDDDQTLLLR